MAEYENAAVDDDVSRCGLVTCFGEMLVDFVPTKAGLSLAEAPTYERAAGGAPANVAVGIARLGGRSAFVGKVGDDGFGHMLAGVLKSNGVDCQGIRFDGEARTALAFVTLRHDGEREFMFYRNPSADMLLNENELDVELIEKSAIFHYGSISLISEPCRTAHLAAMRIAKSSGALLSYDANLRLQLWPSAEEARRGILSVWSDADIVKVSDDEVGFLCGKEDLDVDAAALRLMHPSTKLLLVTEGARGCRYYTPEFRGRVESIKVVAVDTTGAGDAFMGGILSQIALRPAILCDEEGLKEAIAFANACGAITTTSKGAIPALPDRAAVLQLLQSRA